MSEINYKVCSKCGVSQPDENYAWRREGLRRAECKSCRYEYSKNYRVQHREKIRDYNVTYSRLQGKFSR